MKVTEHHIFSKNHGTTVSRNAMSVPAVIFGYSKFANLIAMFYFAPYNDQHKLQYLVNTTKEGSLSIPTIIFKSMD